MPYWSGFRPWLPYLGSDELTPFSTNLKLCNLTQTRRNEGPIISIDVSRSELIIPIGKTKLRNQTSNNKNRNERRRKRILAPTFPSFENWHTYTNDMQWYFQLSLHSFYGILCQNSCQLPIYKFNLLDTHGLRHLNIHKGLSRLYLHECKQRKILWIFQ